MMPLRHAKSVSSSRRSERREEAQSEEARERHGSPDVPRGGTEEKPWQAQEDGVVLLF